MAYLLIDFRMFVLDGILDEDDVEALWNTIMYCLEEE